MRTVVSGALGECIHVADVSNFLHMAETAGWRTIFLGPVISIEELLEAAPHLRGGQIVILNPVRTLGALEFRRTLQDNNCTAGVIVAEGQSFRYASRSEGLATARIFRIIDAVQLAALPASDTAKVR